jgi:hypothetical protein
LGVGRFDVAAGEDAAQAIGAAARGASTPRHAPRCASGSGERLRPRGRPRGDRHYSRPRDRQRRRVRERRPTGICEWLREHRRRSCALRSAAGLLRAHAVRPTAAPERQRVCQLQRPVGQRRRVQLGRCRSLAESHWRADDVLLSLAATSSCPNRRHHPWCTASCTGQFRRYRPSAGLALRAAAARHAPMRWVDENAM